MTTSSALAILPNDWTVKALIDVCTMRSGGTPPKSDAAMWAGDVPWVSGKDLKTARLSDSTDHITREAAESYSRIAPAGSVLVLVRGMGLVNGFALSLIERPMAFNQDLKALVPSEGVSGAFLMYALTFAGQRMLRNVTDAAHGTKRLSQDDLDTFSLPVPSPKEQRLIARVLDRVREACDAEQACERKTRELKLAAMHEIFSRGLRGEPQRDTPFGPIPASWEERSLDTVAVIQTGVAKGRRFADADMVDVPYLRVANVQDGHLDLREIKRIPLRRGEVSRYLLRAGDVLLTEGGDFDKLGRGFIWRGEIEQCVHQNHVFAVRPDATQLLPEFFAYLAQSPYGKAYFLQVAHKTTNLACINTVKLKAFPVVIPSLEEQREIAATLATIDRKIGLHKRKGTVLEDLFKALLHRLMTAEIRVSDLDLSALPAAIASEALS